MKVCASPGHHARSVTTPCPTNAIESLRVTRMPCRPQPVHDQKPEIMSRELIFRTRGSPIRLRASRTDGRARNVILLLVSGSAASSFLLALLDHFGLGRGGSRLGPASGATSSTGAHGHTCTITCSGALISFIEPESATSLRTNALADRQLRDVDREVIGDVHGKTSISISRVHNFQQPALDLYAHGLASHMYRDLHREALREVVRFKSTCRY